MQDIRETIIQHGWKQGKLLKADTIGIEKIFFPRDLRRNNVFGFFIVSQTCDIAQPDLSKEPLIECLAVFEVDSSDKAKVDGRNSRNYHYDYQESSYSIDIWDLGYIDKKFAIGTDINNEDELPEKILKSIAQWKARRYTRAAWPDKFNNRTSKFFKSKKWKRLVKKNSECLYGIYLRIDPREETNESYSVSFKFVLANEDFKLESINLLSDEVHEVLEELDREECIQCVNFSDEFVEFEDTVVMRNQFSILDMQSYLRWQDGDFHSANPENTQEIVSDD